MSRTIIGDWLKYKNKQNKNKMTMKQERFTLILGIISVFVIGMLFGVLLQKQHKPTPDEWTWTLQKTLNAVEEIRQEDPYFESVLWADSTYRSFLLMYEDTNIY